MQKAMGAITVCLIVLFLMGDSGMATAENGKNIGSSGRILIRPNAIIMPLGRILLIRKDTDYGAVKFIKFWTGKSEDDLFATYESYYQGDKTGDFANKNVRFIKEELHFPKPSFSLFGHPVVFGRKEDIRCGPIRLWWSGGGAVYFFKRDQDQGDYGIELAPSKWTDISQVNISDPRLKWYRYDEKRKDIKIPVEQLWEDIEK